MDYKQARVDLHIHSTASDGSFSPREIVRLARERGIRAIALTDHDSVEGIKELQHSETCQDIELLTGVEISTAPPQSVNYSGSLHLLGYGMNVEDDALAECLQKQQRARTERTPKIISRLRELGFAASYGEIRETAGSQHVERPHIAAWMVAKGYAASMDEAFDCYLGLGKPAYVKKPRVPVADAIGQIRAAGGLAVLAHPGLLEVGGTAAYEQLVVELMSMGLQGIEVYYSKHTRQQRAFFREMADKLGLLVTGGSDFHGDAAPEIELGTGTGDLFVPYSLYKIIVDKLSVITS
ncbi:MAG: PHP domain-containing protein [Desulfosalsimonadaceae bacterium]